MCLFTCWVQTKPFPQNLHLYFSSLVWDHRCEVKFFSTFILNLLQMVQTRSLLVCVFAWETRSPFLLKSLPHPFFAQIQVFRVLCIILWVVNSLSNVKLSSHTSQTNCLFKLWLYMWWSLMLGELKLFLHTGHSTAGWFLLWCSFSSPLDGNSLPHTLQPQFWGWDGP